MAVIRQRQQQLVASSLILAESELKLKSNSELAPFQCEFLLQTVFKKRRVHDSRYSESSEIAELNCPLQIPLRAPRFCCPFRTS